MAKTTKTRKKVKVANSFRKAQEPNSKFRVKDLTPNFPASGNEKNFMRSKPSKPRPKRPIARA